MRSHPFAVVTAVLAVIAACGDNIQPEVGIDIEPTSLTTGEAGASATFTVGLRAAPTGDITIAVAVDDATEGTVDLTRLVFTPSDFDPITVTVTGVDDADDDGDITFHVVLGAAEGGDDRYRGLDPADITVTNTDDDTASEAGILVQSGPDPATSETGAQTTFTVNLTSAPTADVTIPVTSSDLTEGTVDPATLTFTPGNWDQAQTVTATGVDDALDDGDQIYSMVLGAATSTDPAYAGLDGPDMQITNVDDDGVGITVSPLAGLITTEAGGFDTVEIVLGSEPSADVTVAVSTTDASEGTVDVASVTFTPTDWDQPQAVTVTGVGDSVDDGDIVYQVVFAAAVSTDPTYNGIDPADAAATNLDDDAAGITVIPTTDLVTTELGGTDGFTIELGSEPTADVTITIASSDPGEGTVDVTSVTFTAADWDQPRAVTVTGEDDVADDGDQAYEIQLAPATSTDPAYAGLDAPDLSATNLDDDAAGFLVVPGGGLEVSEDLTTDTFTIVLTSQPTADVTIDLTSDDPSEGSVSPTTVTFTTIDWDQVQTVTVTGANDAVRDGPQEFDILTAPAVSTDPAYAGQNPINVNVTNFDNEPPSVQILSPNPLVTTEDLNRDRFRVRLTRPPIANVVCSFTSSDTGEATVAPAVISFTPVTWATYQIVTVFGTDDPLDDGDQPFTVISAPCVSADPAYAGVDPRDLDGINQDND